MTSHPSTARFLLAASVLCLGSALPASAQVISRPVCDARDCAPEVFRAHIDSIVHFEGARTSDRSTERLEVMRWMVRDTLERRPDDARLWLALSEIEAGLGDLIPAARAARRARSLGADSALTLRAEAEALLRRVGHEERGAELYMDALDHLDRASADRFLADLYPLMSEVEFDYWHSVETARRGEWLQRYWEHRAALAGLGVAERLAGHYRRLARAAELFDPPGTGSGAAIYDAILWRGEDRRLPFDERGIVYVRRGPPLNEMRASPDLFSGLPTVVWSYRRADGSIDLFYFAQASEGGTGYRMVAPPSCGAGVSFADAAFNPGPASTEAGWIARQSGRDGGLNRSLASCFGGDDFTRRANASLNSMAARRVVLEALRVESPRRPFEQPIDAVFDFYTFRGTAGETDVVAGIAVPMPDRETESLVVRTTFADQGGGVIGRRSSSSRRALTLEPDVIDPDGSRWSFAYTSTLVEPTNATSFRVVLEDAQDPTRGGLWGGTIQVPSYAGDGLLMSDIVLSASGPVTWRRGATTLPLRPGRSFDPGETLLVFYEIYNLEAGQSYTTELALEPSDRGLVQRVLGMFSDDNTIRVRFESTVLEDGAGTLQEMRTLRADLEPGVYTLRVEVQSADGASVTRERKLVVTPPN